MKIRTGNKQSHGVKCYASGGRVPEDISDPGSLPKMASPKMADGGMIDGDKAKPRLDRAGGGKKGTVVNIVIAGGSKPDQPPAPAPMPMPPPAPPMAGPPVPPPMPPAGGPPVMRKHGGRVNMDAGAGSGLGRLEKIGKK